MVNGKKLAVGTSNHGTRPESERSELSGEVGSVHPGVEPPDLVSDPRVLQAFGRQPLLQLLEVGRVVADLIDLPVRNLEPFVVVMSSAHF